MLCRCCLCYADMLHTSNCSAISFMKVQLHVVKCQIMYSNNKLASIPCISSTSQKRKGMKSEGIALQAPKQRI